jgi:hypothetical protein
MFLQIQQYQIKDSKACQPSTKIDFIQTATGGFAGTTEERVLNWEIVHHTDYIYGTVAGQSHFIHGSTGKDGSIRPDFELQTATESAEIKQFLRGEIELDWTKSSGFLVEEQDGLSGSQTPGLWVHTFERNEKLGWTAEQVRNAAQLLYSIPGLCHILTFALKVWGFEMIGESRYFSRRVVAITSKGQYKCARIVFDFVGL